MLDRESIYVKNNIYEATFLATDNGKSLFQIPFYQFHLNSVLSVVAVILLPFFIYIIVAKPVMARTGVWLNKRRFLTQISI